MSDTPLQGRLATLFILEAIIIWKHLFQWETWSCFSILKWMKYITIEDIGPNFILIIFSINISLHKNMEWYKNWYFLIDHSLLCSFNHDHLFNFFSFNFRKTGILGIPKPKRVSFPKFIKRTDCGIIKSSSSPLSIW